jgi:hypothetical protein
MAVSFKEATNLAPLTLPGIAPAFAHSQTRVRVSMSAPGFGANDLRSDDRDPACAFGARGATNVAGVDLKLVTGLTDINHRSIIDNRHLLEASIDAAPDLSFEPGTYTQDVLAKA